MKYQLFGEHCGAPVSEFALGAGNFGMRWGYGSEPDEVQSMLEGFVEAGGNFIDTADIYQFGESEEVVGRFVASNRDEFVIASKYTSGSGPGGGFGSTGNSRKTMVQAVEASLKRLKTDRIDIYWVHFPDGLTPIEEIVRGFDDLVSSGKIVYAGLSDFPAWRVARAATIAEIRGLAPIVGVQTEYSLVERTSDRELLPMADAMGLGKVAWGVLGGGLLSGKYRRGEQGRADTMKLFVHQEGQDAQKTRVVDALHAVAAETGFTPGQIALAWVRQKGVVPILGPRSRAHLDDNLGAVGLSLEQEHLDMLDTASRVDLGFPHDMIATEIARKADLDPRLARLQRPARPVR